MPDLRLTPAELALAKAQLAITKKDPASAVLAFEQAAKAGAALKLTFSQGALWMAPRSSELCCLLSR